MLCARVVRGINSSANEMTPVWAICWITFIDPQGSQEADKDLLTAQQRKVRLPGNIIRAAAQNLDDDIRTPKDRTAIRKDLGAFFDIESIRIARLRPCTGLDQHFESRLSEMRDHHGNNP